MGLNNVVAQIALMELEKFKSDSSLYDAIVEMDTKLIKWLCNNKYKLLIGQNGYIKEQMSISKMISIIEEKLDRNKMVRLIC